MVTYGHILGSWDAGGVTFVMEKESKDFSLGKVAKTDSAGSRLNDSQLSHAGPQRAAIESKKFCGSVFSAHLPLRLLKHLDNVVTLDIIQCFWGHR